MGRGGGGGRWGGGGRRSRGWLEVGEVESRRVSSRVGSGGGIGDGGLQALVWSSRAVSLCGLRSGGTA